MTVPPTSAARTRVLAALAEQPCDWLSHLACALAVLDAPPPVLRLAAIEPDYLPERGPVPTLPDNVRQLNGGVHVGAG